MLKVKSNSKEQYVSPNNYVLAITNKDFVNEIEGYASYGAIPFRQIIGYKSREAKAYLSNDSTKVKDGDTIYFLPIPEKVTIIKQRENDIIIAIHSDAIIAIVPTIKEEKSEEEKSEE